MRLVPLDEPPHPCGYLPDRDATYGSYLMLEATPEEREALLNGGYRSFGKYYFRPQCASCHQCVPLRIPVDKFVPTKSQRRCWRRCQNIDVMVDTPRYTEEKFEIYKDHLQRFQHKSGGSTAEDFAFTFYDSTIPVLEFCYYLEGVLVAVGIVNVTPSALSSVYFGGTRARAGDDAAGLCLVAFDEAFSKLDEAVRYEMVSFCQDLGLQLLICGPDGGRQSMERYPHTIVDVWRRNKESYALADVIKQRTRDELKVIDPSHLSKDELLQRFEAQHSPQDAPALIGEDSGA